ncbi:MAG: hypothetical protein LBS36_00150 [Oscillospiraceae bacterium]|nr:hypothetical protein [Oscillospiraceae bacterium]
MGKTIEKNSFSAGFRLLAVLCGAFWCGMLWHIRGGGGFGSKWGMFAVAAGFSLFLFFVFGERKKIAYNLFPLFVFLTGITAGPWGTLSMQMTGELDSSAPFVGETVNRVVEISPWSGLFIMLCLGFGWMPFFAMFIGYYFSGRRYRLRELAVGAVLFYAVYYLSKAVTAHGVVSLACPDAVQLFKDGLADSSLDSSPFTAYLQHFNSDAWAKKIPGGRNYFASITVVSSTLGTLAVYLYQRFLLKDKFGGRLMLCVSGIAAGAIVLADIPMIANGKNALISAPWLSEALNGLGLWTLWEYATGFFIGLGVMILCFIAAKRAPKESVQMPEAFPVLPAKLQTVYGVLVSLYAAVGLTLIRPFAGRIADGNNAVNYPLIVVLSVIAIIYCAFASKSILPRGGAQPFAGEPFRSFCMRAVPVYFLIVSGIFFVAEKDAQIRTGEVSPMMVLMMISFGVVVLTFAPLLALKRKQEKSAA